jgi:hypothetical protein
MSIIDDTPNKSLQPTATAQSVTDERSITRSRHAGCLRIRRAVASVQLVPGVMLGGGC